MIGRSIPVILFLAAVAYVVTRALTGCTPAEGNAVAMSVENAKAVAQYDQALVDCKKEAKRLPKAERFDAYEDCEDHLSRHFCNESASLRKYWPRCGVLGLGEE